MHRPTRHQKHRKAAQQSEKVASDPALAALAAQSAYATPQGQIDGSWWDIAKVYATAAKEATTDEELKAIEDEVDEAIDDAVEYAKAAPYPTLESALEDVYAD